MYSRRVIQHAIKSLKYFPVLAILGPRQCGKTTLAKEIMMDYPDALYLDMERPSDLRKLEDPFYPKFCNHLQVLFFSYGY